MSPQPPPTIFGSIAPIYWNLGLSVIPLKPSQKRPAIEAWTRYAKVLPSPQEQTNWLKFYPTGNIGLAAGPASNILFLDVDTENQKVHSILGSLLPTSPWKRIGAKGFVAAYRYNPALDHSFQIKDVDNKILVELLTTGRQAVLPPSIHPDTLRPYTANCELFSCHTQLPILPSNLEATLRHAFQSENIELSHSGLSRITEFVPAGSRDNTMVSLAGLCAMDITRGRLTLQEAFDRMSTWYENLTEKVIGDAIDLPKGQTKILEFLHRDVTGPSKRPLPLGWDRGLSSENLTLSATMFTDEHKEWSFTQIKDYLYDQFQKFADPRAPERYQTIEYVLERISRSPSINMLEKEILLKYISDVARIPGLTIPNLRKRLLEISRGELEGTDHAALAKATIAHFEQFGTLRYHDNHFWQWKGAHWEILDDLEILRVIAEEFGEYQAAKRQADHRGIFTVMQAVTPRNLRSIPLHGANFANYFLSWEGKPLPHIPELGCTFTLPYRHVPDSAHLAHKFQKLLHDCWGHDPDYPQKVASLQEMICATLFGLGPMLQRAFLLYGIANSGKTTLINIIKALFPGSAISVVPPDQWGDRFAPTMMHEKILNVCGELPEKRMIDGKSLKEIIDGSEIVGQHKGKSLFKFSPRCTHWFASNHLPKTMDTSEGFNRRFLILHFNRPVPLNQKVLGLHNIIIEEEREAIVAWALSAAPRLLATKDYTLPPSHIDLINEMASENNSVRFFLLECPKVLTLKKLQSLDEKYQGWDTPTTPPLLSSLTPTPPFIPDGMTIPPPSAPGSPPSTPSRTNGQSAGAGPSPPSARELLTRNGSNPTSEESVYSEYVSFCSEIGGVRYAGLRQFRKRMKDLEYEIGFKVHVHTNSIGMEIHMYEGLIVVSKNQERSASSSPMSSLSSTMPAAIIN